MSKDFSNVLKEANLKVTPTRLAVLNVFSGDCRPINAEYIFEKLKAKKINLVTVYRTLSSFEKSDILKRVNLHKESIYYELDDHHHHHIVCTECAEFEKFEGCISTNLSSFSKEILNKSKKFNMIKEHSFEFFGTCKKCLKK